MRRQGMQYRLTVLVGSFCLVLALAYGGFRLYRWFNWTFGYEDLVKQTVETMVKPECLKKLSAKDLL